ncbi:MAG: hypothetical protein NVS4B8_15810 [Herpetosiphon sp.]
MHAVLTETAREALQRQMMALVRGFGLHRPEVTPCGEALSIAEAHALMELFSTAPVSQTTLCSRLQLVKSTVSRVISLLEARGWVERRRDERDGRAVQLWLTVSGRVAAQQLATARETKFARLMDRIPPEQRDGVVRALQILVEATHE